MNNAYKTFVKDYLSFTRRERRGILFLLTLILLCIIAPYFYPYFLPVQHYDHTAFEKEIAGLRIRQADSNGSVNENRYDPGLKDITDAQPTAALFQFDPNTLSVEGWKKLGIRDKTIGTIQNYLSKGGQFKQPEDIGKIWGLRPEEVQQLQPYIRIASRPPPFTEKRNYEKKAYTKASYSQTSIDVNTADTTEWIALPGIGSKLANRIVNFRERLGGFYSIDQVGETFALPDSTFRKIKPRLTIGHFTLKQIDINSAGIDEMKLHPYIRYNLANIIFQYRVQHGNYMSVEGIKKIMVITEEIYQKLSPYLAAK